MKNSDNNEIIYSKWLDGNLTDEERNQLKEAGELEALGKLRIDLDKLFEKPPDDIEVDISAYNPEKELAKFKKKIKPDAPIITLPKSRSRMWMKIAASLLFIVAAGIYFLITPTETLNVTTPQAQKEIINLSDGSIVHLNVDTKIEYKPTFFNRKISLKGEAFFEVESSKKPFIVETELGAIKVLGTSFNVYSRDNIFRVICNTGKVQVNSKSQIFVLDKGERLVINNRDNPVKDNIAADYSPWKNGISSFENVPLREVLSEIERQFGVEIKTEGLDDSSPLTINFPNNNLAQALDELNIIIKFSYQINDKQVLLKTDK